MRTFPSPLLDAVYTGPETRSLPKWAKRLPNGESRSGKSQDVIAAIVQLEQSARDMDYTSWISSDRML